jgi:hypothetical protein
MQIHSLISTSDCSVTTLRNITEYTCLIFIFNKERVVISQDFTIKGFHGTSLLTLILLESLHCVYVSSLATFRKDTLPNPLFKVNVSRIGEFSCIGHWWNRGTQILKPVV